LLYELSEGISIVAGYPGLLLTKHDSLVIADIHLGFESAISESGVYVPRKQLTKIIEILDELIEITKPARVIINGDLKHGFSRLLRQEREEIVKLIDFLRSKGVSEVIVVRGNHDNYVSLVLRDLGVNLVDKLIIDEIMITHGHEFFDPRKYDVKTIIIGHEHPSISLRDELGIPYKFQCFLKGKLITNHEIIVLAHMSIYASGNSVTLDREAYLSPIVKKYGLIEYFKPYIIDKEVGVLELPVLKDLVMMYSF